MSVSPDLFVTDNNSHIIQQVMVPVMEVPSSPIFSPEECFKSLRSLGTKDYTSFDKKVEHVTHPLSTV